MLTSDGGTMLTKREVQQIADSLETVLDTLGNICPVDAREFLGEDEYYVALDFINQLRGHPKCKKCKKHYLPAKKYPYECEWCEHHPDDEDDS